MSHRPLVLVSGLALGDYALWNWSLGSGNDVLAIISGLSLLPLVLTTAWLLALNFARVLARSTRPRSARTRIAGSRPAPSDALRSVRALHAGAMSSEADQEHAQTAVVTAPSDKLAA